MREFQELRETTNNYVFNKLYKKYLEHKGKIRCSYCSYHGGENDTNKWYGDNTKWRSKRESIFRYPNWKLVSKNRKQWMKKPLKKKIKKSRYYDDYFEWIW